MRQTRQRGSTRKPRPVDTRQAPGFVRPPHMATAKSIVDKKRQKEITDAVEEFLGPPPQGRGSIEVRLVIPGDDMIPRGLDNPARLDGIRRGCKVWITNIEPHIFSFRGDSVMRLRQAIREFNDVMHDLRLANECLDTRFMVQKPCRNTSSLPIRFLVESRPYTQLQTRAQARGPREFSFATKAHAVNMWTELLSRLDLLTSCGTSLRMRVKFGYLNILQKQKDIGETVSLDDFARAMKMYSGRGGAKLNAWLHNPRIAEDVCLHLVDPKTGICSDRNSIKRSHSLIVKINNQELLLKAFSPTHGSAQLSVDRLVKIEDIPRLNYTIAAPDMQFDWSLQVDSFEESSDMPLRVLELIKEISLKLPTTEDAETLSLDTPRLEVSKPGSWCDMVSETNLRTSITIPIKASPYAVKVSVMQKWKGLTPNKPEVGWGIEMYGVHWDEAVNEVRPGERKKDWGPKMEKIWGGTEQGSETKFQEFIQTILEVQGALDDVETTEV